MSNNKNLETLGSLFYNDAFQRAVAHFSAELDINVAESNIWRATKEAHKFVDSEMEKTYAASKPSCKKGCSFCCYIHVEVSDTEAQILAPKVTPEMMLTLMLQSQYNLGTWGKIPYKERKCVFLKNNECSVYEDRPLSCRKYAVVNSPKRCNTEHEIHKTTILANGQAEAATAAVHLKWGNQSMAKQLLKFKR